MLYAILRKTGSYSCQLLLEYTDKDSAIAYLKAHNLRIVEQRVYDDEFTQWFVVCQ